MTRTVALLLCVAVAVCAAGQDKMFATAEATPPAAAAAATEPLLTGGGLVKVHQCWLKAKNSTCSYSCDATLPVKRLWSSTVKDAKMNSCEQYRTYYIDTERPATNTKPSMPCQLGDKAFPKGVVTKVEGNKVTISLESDLKDFTYGYIGSIMCSEAFTIVSGNVNEPGGDLVVVMATSNAFSNMKAVPAMVAGILLTGFLVTV